MLFQDSVTDVSPKHVGCMGRGGPNILDNKTLRASTRLMINRTQLKFKNQ